ncbi:hypothetical protein APY03_1260 [Variovorax sp. WDL1]|nr:hypothetical protein APY03_1260 [Variovorax sp. WDL1]
MRFIANQDFDEGLRLALFDRLDAGAARIEDFAGGPVACATVIPALAMQLELARVRSWLDHALIRTHTQSFFQ